MKATIMQQNQNFNRVQYKCVLNLGSRQNKDNYNFTSKIAKMQLHIYVKRLMAAFQI